MNNRYLRQQQVPQLGAESSAMLASAKVLVVGVGGLGAPVSSYLVGAGVGSITLLDHDVVELSNLHRQTLFKESDVGGSKALVAQERLLELNQSIEINGLNQSLSVDNARELISSHTVIVDAADNLFVSYLLSDLCFEYRIPLVAASVLQTSGYVGVFCGTKEHPAPSMRAIFPSPPRQAKSCSTSGVTGPSVGIVGSLQAQEVLKVIVNDKSQLLGKLLYVDCWLHSQNTVDFSDAQEPGRFATLISSNSITGDDQVLDVRTEQEIVQNPNALVTVKIPLQRLDKNHQLLAEELSDKLHKDRRIVCVCQTGQRAIVGAKVLMNAGFSDVAVAQSFID